ncbi:MAG: ERCC4 domain-containing protein [Patescibacteria group bacterium]
MKEKKCVAVIDTREQLPLRLEDFGLETVKGTLAWGDYSLAGLEKLVALERKSIDDFTACCGKERGRFEKEVLALRGYPVKAIVCEFKFSDILAHNYRSKITPESVVGSIERWIISGIPFLMAETPDGAAWFVAGILKKVYADVVNQQFWGG